MPRFMVGVVSFITILQSVGEAQLMSGYQTKRESVVPLEPAASGPPPPNNWRNFQTVMERGRPSSSLISVTPTSSSTTGNERAHATVQINGGRARELLPNVAGLFPVITMPAVGIAQIKVIYPDGNPSEPVIIDFDDKSKKNGDRIIIAGKLDASRAISFRLETTQNRLHSRQKWNSSSIAFRFKTGNELKVHQLTLHKGADSKVLDVLSGPERSLDH